MDLIQTGNFSNKFSFSHPRHKQWRSSLKLHNLFSLTRCASRASCPPAQTCRSPLLCSVLKPSYLPQKALLSFWLDCLWSSCIRSVSFQFAFVIRTWLEWRLFCLNASKLLLFLFLSTSFHLFQLHSSSSSFQACFFVLFPCQTKSATVRGSVEALVAKAYVVQ